MKSKMKCNTNKIVQLLEDPAMPTQQEIVSHLDSCEHCQAFLNHHVASEAEWHRAKNLLQPGEFDVAKTADYSAAGLLEGRLAPNAQDVLDSLTPTDDPHRLGRIGSYEVSGVIGVGGMGVVLKAIEPALDRVVAIKVMSPSLAGNEKARRRFAREARPPAPVLHPNVIPIYSVSNEEKLSYLVMAYIPGGSLQKRIDQQGPFPVEEILRIGVQIAGGLEASHQHGLVHRDIKPENVLLEVQSTATSTAPNVRVKIADFGLAKLLGEPSEGDKHLTATHQVMGTPRYMAPEQMEGSSTVDHRADIYSMGVVFYEMLTGELPLGRFALPSEKVAIDTRLDEVVLRSLEREPDRRYQQASEVQTDLSAIEKQAFAAPPMRQPAFQPPNSSPPKKPVDESVARRVVAGPSNGLIVVGLFELLAFVLFIFSVPFLFVVRTDSVSDVRSSIAVPANVDIIGVTIANKSLATVVLAQQAAWPTFALLFVGVAFLSGLTLGLLFIIAGIKMKKLRLYPLALIASIAAMLPCHPGFIIGLPIGIWSLVVLSRTDVRQAFQQVNT